MKSNENGARLKQHLFRPRGATSPTTLRPARIVSGWNVFPSWSAHGNRREVETETGNRKCPKLDGHDAIDRKLWLAGWVDNSSMTIWGGGWSQLIECSEVPDSHLDIARAHPLFPLSRSARCQSTSTSSPPICDTWTRGGWGECDTPTNYTWYSVSPLSLPFPALGRSWAK